MYRVRINAHMTRVYYVPQVKCLVKIMAIYVKCRDNAAAIHMSRHLPRQTLMLMLFDRT